MCPCTHSFTLVGFRFMQISPHVYAGFQLGKMYASQVKLQLPGSASQDLKGHIIKTKMQNKGK